MSILYFCAECAGLVRVLPVVELPRHAVCCACCGVELDDDEVNGQ